MTTSTTVELTPEQMNAMVQRFLGWRLPKTFSPDCYISFDRDRAGKVDGFGNGSWPIGTNLFSADEARQMLEFMLRGDDKSAEKAAAPAGPTS